MDAREYIVSRLKKFELDDDEIGLILVENNIVEDGSNVNVTEVKTAICKSLSVWLPIHSSISEGGVQKQWNIEALKLYYSALCNELGIEDVYSVKATVRDASNKW